MLLSMKRNIGALFLVGLLLAGKIGATASSTDIRATESVDTLKIKILEEFEFFFGSKKEEFVIYNNFYEDITQQFYQDFKTNFNNNEIEPIWDFVEKHIRRIEKVTVTEVATNARVAGDVTVNIKMNFYEKLQTTGVKPDINIYSTWIEGSMLGSYVKNDYFGIIMSANLPTLSSPIKFYERQPDFGWQPHIKDQISYNPIIGNNNTIVTFKMDLIVTVTSIEEHKEVAIFPTLTLKNTYGV